MMTNQELQKLVEELSTKEFNLPFEHQASFNSRLKTTGGRYHLSDHHLDFNPKILINFGLETFIGIIKHELCHYHLHLAKKGYQHKDSDFKELLQKTGGLRYAPSFQKSKKVIYVCVSCQQKFIRARNIDTAKYRCGKCQGRLKRINEYTSEK